MFAGGLFSHSIVMAQKTACTQPVHPAFPAHHQLITTPPNQLNKSNGVGQGLIVASEETFGSSSAYSSTYTSQKEAIVRAAEWRQTYKAMDARRRVRVVLSSAGEKSSMNADGNYILHVATSPDVYSSIDPDITGGKVFVPAPSDQRPCATCVAHASSLRPKLQWQP